MQVNLTPLAIVFNSVPSSFGESVALSYFLSLSKGLVLPPRRPGNRCQTLSQRG